jgi:hypothetical protein
MIKAIVIHADSTFSVTEIDGKLKSLQSIVGGYLEEVGSRDVTLFINEEGKFEDLPLNHLATVLWWVICPHMAGQDILRGDAIVLGPVDANGNETSVTADTMWLLAEILSAKPEFEEA